MKPLLQGYSFDSENYKNPLQTPQKTYSENKHNFAIRANFGDFIVYL